jgi:hypothetical protein
MRMRDEPSPLIFGWRDNIYDHILISHNEGWDVITPDVRDEFIPPGV